MAFPLAELLSLTMFHRLLYLASPGLMLNSARLDLLFTFPMESEILGIGNRPEIENGIPPMLLLEPSLELYNQSLQSIQANTYSDHAFFKDIPAIPAKAEDKSIISIRTSSIHLEDDQFDSTTFAKTTSYVHISDPAMPGPEFNAPNSNILRARPKQVEQRKAWGDVYERFRQQRMDVCGLDLQPTPGYSSGVAG